MSIHGLIEGAFFILIISPLKSLVSLFLQYMLTRGPFASIGNLVPTSTPCKMDDVWLENTFSFYFGPITDHGYVLTTRMHLPT
jgi:hypothetical protein